MPSESLLVSDRETLEQREQALLQRVAELGERSDGVAASEQAIIDRESAVTERE